MKRTIAVALTAALASTSALGARSKELTVILKWNPNEKPSIPVLETTGGVRSLTIAAVVDRRDKGKQIGENLEGKVPVPVVTQSDVAGYVREHLAGQLKAIGIDLSDGEGGDRILKSELIELWVAEEKRYRGSLRMKVTISDSNGKEIWSALVGGSSDNFGRSLKPDNYTESVSDALQDLVAKLVAAPGFRSAMVKTP